MAGQGADQWRPVLDQAGNLYARVGCHPVQLVAIRFNGDLQVTYQQLLKSGKAKKIAITAVMRRMIVLANTLLREGRDWQLERP